MVIVKPKHDLWQFSACTGVTLRHAHNAHSWQVKLGGLDVYSGYWLATDSPASSTEDALQEEGMDTLRRVMEAAGINFYHESGVPDIHKKLHRLEGIPSIHATMSRKLSTEKTASFIELSLFPICPFMWLPCVQVDVEDFATIR